MARIPRSIILRENYQAHKFWRGHNREWNISTNDEKKKYIDQLNKLLPKQSNELLSFTTMFNHAHEVFDINDQKEFSNLMRDHHSSYGSFYNKKHKRQGKVAYDRPKTCLIESEECSMRAIFYIHANPVRANITKNAANYIWSTHRLYAFGKRDELTKNVKFPKWYMDLGNTPKLRQKRYRKMFDAYLRGQGLIKQDFIYKNFYGSAVWIEQRKIEVKEYNKFKGKDPPTPQITELPMMA